MFLLNVVLVKNHLFPSKNSIFVSFLFLVFRVSRVLPVASLSKKMNETTVTTTMSSDIVPVVSQGGAQPLPTTSPMDIYQMKCLILDSNAFIRGYGLANLCKKAEHLVTIDEVIDEIRDSKAKETLLNLPFELETRTPSAAVCKEGKIDFCRIFFFFHFHEFCF
jgi:hypothetical protein